MELINEILQTTINSFDFGLVISINIASYIIINIVNDIVKNNINKWYKRLIMCGCAVILSSVYHTFGVCEDYLILNSTILAPVFWSWIGKPILHRFNIDYKDFDNSKGE